MPQNNNKTAKTIISRLYVVLFEEIRNLKIKPKTKPIAKQSSSTNEGTEAEDHELTPGHTSSQW